MSRLASVDRRLARPQRLRDAIVAKVGEATRAAGCAIPTEVGLARDAGVAVGTVREILDLLVAEGALDRVQGHGSFVRRPSPDHSLFGSSGCRRGSPPVPALRLPLAEEI